MLRTKEQKAITLIALVITIIIMLILANVSINLTLGENGILTRAKEAKERMEIATIKEQIQMDILAERLGNNGKISEDRLKEILEKYGTLSDEENIEDKTLTTDNGNYEIKVSDILNGVIITDGTDKPGGDKDPEEPTNPTPFQVKIELSATTAYANQTIKATVYQEEMDKGIKIDECKWALVKGEQDLGTDDDQLYVGGTFTEVAETLDLTVSEPGIYFLHVLSTNNEGEKVETKSEAITFNEIITASFENTGTGSIESYTIPISGLYQLQAYGASGGQASTSSSRPKAFLRWWRTV